MQINKKELNIKFIQKLMGKGFSPIILSILNRRGFSQTNDIVDFLYPVFERIDSPFYFKQIIKAYNRLDKAIINNEKILIYGDKDVDGTTSIALIYDFLKKLNINSVEWDLPLEDDAYGIVLDKLKYKDFNLLITVDCGISSSSEISYLNSIGIDTIVIDHHSPQENNVPEAYSIINPQNNEIYPVKEMSASGVSFIFILGYFFYKSNYFNKRIGLIFFENNKLCLNIYKNMIFIESHNLTTIPNPLDLKNNFNIDLIFVYKNKHFDLEENNVQTLDNIKSIHNKLDLYENESVKAQISLFNKIYNSIEEIQKIKKIYLIYSMFGLIADMMPLIKTNRIIVSEGLRYLRKSHSLMLKEMIKKLKLEQQFLGSTELSWKICPLLNASGRMGKADLTVKTLLNENDSYFIDQLILQNEERKRQSDIAYNLFTEYFDENSKDYKNNIAFFYSEKIAKGVTGITATKLSKENNNCPTIVASCDNDIFTGSVRGDTEYHLVEFLSEAKEILSQFGGHKAAAGFSLEKNNLKAFIEFLKLKSHLLMTNNENDKIISKQKTIDIDAEIPLEYLNIKLLQNISILEPFGQYNHNPVLYTKKIHIINYKIIGKNKDHLRITFSTNDSNLPTIVGLFWSKGKWFETYYDKDKTYNVVYKIEYNHFNGQVIPQLIIIDIEKSI